MKGLITIYSVIEVAITTKKDEELNRGADLAWWVKSLKIQGEQKWVSKWTPQISELAKLPGHAPGPFKHSFSYMPASEEAEMQTSV